MSVKAKLLFKQISMYFETVLISPLLYILHSLFGNKTELEQPDIQKPAAISYCPEEIWNIFLGELDFLFNEKNILLSYALYSACALTAVKTNGVYVLDDSEFDEFSYNEVILKRVRNHYLKVLNKYFNEDYEDLKLSKKKAKQHVIEEIRITENELNELMEEFDFNENTVINAV